MSIGRKKTAGEPVEVRRGALWAAFHDGLTVVRHCLSVLSVATVVVTGGFLVLLESCGERHWVLGILIYVPYYVWCTPMVGLFLVCLLFNFRAACFLAVFLLVFTFFGGGYIWRGGVNENNPEGLVTLLSNNVGGRGSRNSNSKVEGDLPDILVLQDVKSMRSYEEQFPNLEVVRLREFGLVTRFSIVESGLVDSPRWGALPIAARYVVQLNEGHRLVLYNVHLPTRRFVIAGVSMSRVFLACLGLGGGLGSQIRAQNQGFFSGQIELVDQLIERAKNETDPVILVGDFNLPAQGYLYRRLTRSFTDAFAVSGRGFGYTFPTRRPGGNRFVRPWIRIDHAFLGERVRPVRTIMRGNGSPEHLAVALHFELSPP